MKVEILNSNCPKMCENAENAVFTHTHTPVIAKTAERFAWAEFIM